MKVMVGLPLLPTRESRPQQAQSSNLAFDTKDDRLSFAIEYLKGIFASVLQIKQSSIEAEETYENYGVDSLLGLALTKRLEQDFGSLSKTLIFEYMTIRKLAGHFVKKYVEKIEKMMQSAQPTAKTIPKKQEILPAQIKRVSHKSQRDVSSSTAKSQVVFAPQDVAIVGMSGIYPDASSVKELWQNLQQGKDCVSQVPGTRWDYRLFPNRVNGKKVFFKWGSFIDDYDKFDPEFFKIPPQRCNLCGSS